jgi:hybrid cluster-associated redox disulfide protein
MAMATPGIDAAMTADEVLRRFPRAIAVFIELKLHCVGCPIASFHTLAEVAREHGLDLDPLLDALHAIPLSQTA